MLDKMIGLVAGIILAVIGFYLNKALEIYKTRNNVKMLPIQIVYNKQIEFYNILNPLILKCYHLVYKLYGNNMDQALNNEKVDLLNELANLQSKYYFYLPKEIIKESNEVLTKSFMFSPDINNKQKIFEEAKKALDTLMSSIRKHIGADKLSADLLKSIGKQPQENNIQQ